MPVFNDNVHYVSLMCSRQPPRKREKFLERSKLNMKLDPATNKNLVVLEGDDEVICCVRPESGVAYATKQIKQVKEKHFGKRVSVVGVDENVVSISQKTSTDGYYFDGLH